MASAASTLPPPPGADGSAGPGGTSPTTPAAAAPSPATPSPMMEQGARMVIGVVSGLRSIAKAFPETAEPISQINNLMRDVQAKMMKSAQPGEAQAPPSGG